MQQPNAAARRFYNAFYRWSTITSPRPSPRTCSRNRSHAYHGSSRLGSEASVHKVPSTSEGHQDLPRVKRYNARPIELRSQAPGTRRLKLRVSQDDASSSRSHDSADVLHVLPRWRDMPVQTSAERPFSSLGAWDEAIRYRIGNGMMLEVALPEKRAHELQRLYGHKLERLSKRSGARVELGSVDEEAKGRERLCSVLISGTMLEAAQVQSAFQSSSREKGPKPLGLTSRSEQEQPSTISSRLSSQEERAAQNQNLGTHPWSERPVQNATEKPFASLRAWETAVRQKGDDSIMVELAIPQDPVGVMQQKYGTKLELLTKETQAKIEASNIAPATKQLASLLISGSFAGFARTYPVLVSYKSINFDTTKVKVTKIVDHVRGWPVKTHKLRPTHSLLPWTTVLRSRNEIDGIATLEVIITERFWQKRLQLGQSFDRSLQDETQVSVDVGSPYRSQVFESTSTAGDDFQRQDDPLEVRSLLLSGTMYQIFRACATLGQASRQDRASKSLVPQITDKALPVTKDPGAAEAQDDEPVPAASGVEQDNELVADQPEVDNETHAAENESAQRAAVADDLKAVLRPLTHPVVLVTSRVRTRAIDWRSPSGEDLAACRGVTVSSFTAVTMTPKPVISFNLKVPSRTWDAIESTGRLCVHLLAASPEAAALTHVFTLPHERPEAPFLMVKQMGAGISLPFSPKGFRLGAPRIVKDGAVIAHIVARLSTDVGLQPVRVGDHVIVIAEVDQVKLARDHATGESIQDAKEELDKAVGLAYSKREYRDIGQALTLPQLPRLEEPSQQTINAEELLQEDELEAAEDADLPPNNEVDDGQEKNAPIDSVAAPSIENPDDYFQAIMEDGFPDEDESGSTPMDDSAQSDGPEHQEPGPERQVPKQADKRNAAAEEEDEYDLGFAQPSQPEPLPPQPEPLHLSTIPSGNASSTPAMPGSGASSRPRQRSDDHAWGLPAKAQKFSTSARTRMQ